MALARWSSAPTRMPDIDVRGQARSRRVKAGQIDRLEELWKQTPSATLDDLEKPSEEESIPHVPLQYDDAYQYQNIFGPLVKLDADYDEAMKSAQTQDQVVVRWDMGLNHKHIAWFTMLRDSSGTPARPCRARVARPRAECDSWQSTESCAATSSSWRTMATRMHRGVVSAMSFTRRMVRLRELRNAPHAAQGACTRADSGESVALELQSTVGVPVQCTHDFRVSVVWKPTTFDRYAGGPRMRAGRITERAAAAALLRH